MDALCSSSIFLSKLPQTANNPVLAQPQFPLNYNPFGSSTINQSFNLSLCVSSSHTHGVRLSGSMIRAVSKDDLGECNDEPLSGSHYATAHPSLSQDIIATPDIIDKASSSPKNTSTEALGDASKIVTPKSAVTGSGPGGGSRAGLWRTPSSGGVQSATSAHGLPTPALAVRNMLEQARFAHLCTVMSRMHHRRQGYPFGTLVDFAPDSMGHPVFSFSPLAIHTRNLLADPRCTLVVQDSCIPGWSGSSNARVTIFGDVFPLPKDQQEWAHQQYIRKHQHGPSQQWGNFYYFRMQNISDIYFVGGFGTVAWVDVKEYKDLKPDKIALDGGEQYLKELNAMFSEPLKELLSIENEVDDAALISIDSKGTDVRVRQGGQCNVQRISFEEGQAVETLEEAKAALHRLISQGRLYNLQK